MITLVADTEYILYIELWPCGDFESQVMREPLPSLVDNPPPSSYMYWPKSAPNVLYRSRTTALSTESQPARAAAWYMLSLYV